jgi:hypothetical protein
MEKIEKKLFSEEVLKDLKNSLPGKYYGAFLKIWEKKYPKTKAPIRQVVYSVLNGISENDKVIEVLTELVDQRNKLRDRLIQATSHDQRHKAAAAN